MVLPDRDGFGVIETFGWDGARFPRLSLHLARLGRTCLALGIGLEPMEVMVRLDALPSAGPLRVRVLVDRQGGVAVSHAPLVAVAGPWRVVVAEGRLASGDPWLRVKTTERARYDAARAALPPGVDEVIFVNERSKVCEGTITNLFFDLGAGLCTPPLSCGLLPGVLRQEMLEAGLCREEALDHSALKEAGLWLGNSLRGLIPARWGGG